MAAKTQADADVSAAVAGATGGAHQHESAMTERKHMADTGVEEAHSGAVLDQTRAWNAKVDRTYEEHETYAHDSRLRARADWEDARDMRRRQAEDLHQLKIQVMQNALVTTDMLAKQAVAHRDIAIDREWNIDEVAKLVAENTVFTSAIAAAVAKAVQDAVASTS